MSKVKVVAVDLDGNLCSTAWTKSQALNAKPNKKRIKALYPYFETCFVIIFTARRDSLISSTLQWLKRNYVPYHAISNLKIPADLYIDTADKYCSLDKPIRRKNEKRNKGI